MLFCLALVSCKDDFDIQKLQDHSRLVVYRVENLPANDGYYYISGNKFYYIDVPVPTTRYRGFFHSDVHNGAMLSLAFGGGTTNIEDVYFLPAGAGDIYDLTGKKVRSSGESLDGLKPGVYITKNKKFVVK